MVMCLHSLALLLPIPTPMITLRAQCWCKVTECSSKRASEDQYEADQTKIPSALTNNTRARPGAWWGWNEKGLTSQRWKDFHLSVSDEKPSVESFVGCKQAKAISQRKQFDYSTTARYWRGNVWPCKFCWVILTEEVRSRGKGVTKKRRRSQGEHCWTPTRCTEPMPTLWALCLTGEIRHEGINISTNLNNQ